MKMKLNDKLIEVVDLVVDGVDARDFPDYCDAFFSEGYEDLGDGELRGLSYDELDTLADQNGDILNAMAYESLY